MVKVAFDHGNGVRQVAANLGRGDIGKGSEVAGVKGSNPGGKGRREQGSMLESNAVSDCGGGLDGIIGERFD